MPCCAKKKVWTNLLLLLKLGGSLLAGLLLALSLLQESLRNENLVLSGNAPKTGLVWCPAYRVWRGAPIGNCSYSAAFSQKANSTVCLIDEMRCMVESFRFLRSWEGFANRFLSIDKTSDRCPRKMRTQASLFITVADCYGTTWRCMAMHLKEKIGTFNLKTPYHVSHDANHKGLGQWGNGSGRIELVDQASVTQELTFDAMALPARGRRL